MGCMCPAIVAACQSMAEPIPSRTITVGRRTLHVVTYTDRRPSSQQTQPTEWMFQAEVERLLFSQEEIGQTGALYRLLNRAGAGGRAIALRRSSVSQGLLSDAEFDALRALVHTGFRLFTLVPLDAVQAAVAVFGPTEASEGLLTALGLPRPAEWDAVDEDESEDEDGSGDPNDGSGSGGSGSGGSGGNGPGGNDSTSSSRNEDDSYPPTEEESDPPDVGYVPGAGQLTLETTELLQTQLSAFVRWHVSTVNRHRKGKAVVACTAAEDRRSILHFFAWLRRVKGVTSPTFNLFAHQQMGAVVQSFAEEKALACKYSRIAKLLAALVSASRFTHAMLQAKTPGVAVSTAFVDQIVALHTQALSEAREQRKFDAAHPPKAWLDWEACQRARLRAEKAIAARGDDAPAPERLSLVRDCCLLKVLTALPPDRVGVYRTLKLGGSLKARGNGAYQIDLSERGAHKTSAIFGPSRTTVTPAVAERIHALVTFDALQEGEFLFHAATRTTPLEKSAWTRYVQAVFKRYAGVAFSPKDCRASFVTFLKDGEHGDETLRAAAVAMRHSSAMADSAAYDKHGSDRIVAAAVTVADAFASRFV